MEEKLLFVNACVRGPERSRTERLARAFLAGSAAAPGAVTEVPLRALGLQPMTEEEIDRRAALAARGAFGDPLFALARDFAAADRILIAAPFWDCSFPAALKVYAERICCEGVTFRTSAEGLSPLCRFRDMVYLSTVGGQPVDGVHHGEAYWRSMAVFLGPGRFHCLSVRELDIAGRDAEALLRAGCEKARQLGEELSRRED